MGTINLLFLLCAKEYYTRNLLLLWNTKRSVSNTYLTSSRVHLFNAYNRLSGNWLGFIASVNYDQTWCMTPSTRACAIAYAICLLYLYSKLKLKLRLARQATLSYVVYSKASKKKINPISPWFISGYSDAEGCFNVGFQKNPNGKFYVRPSFQIKVHSRDNLLLMQIRDYLGGIGNIYTNTKDSKFTVRSLEDILKIITHFDNYPLITQKKADFMLFKQIILKIVEGEHLSAKGLQEIVNIRASMNLGISASLHTIFPNTVPVTRPLIENTAVPHPEWMAGFVTGEGCFLIQMAKYGKDKLDGVSLSFKVSQHLRDELLLRSFISFFGCGLFNYHGSKNRKSGVFIVRKFADISDKILPFFKNHEIRGIKREDFEDWSKVVELIRAKAHLTEAGVEKIRGIKSGMNRLR